MRREKLTFLKILFTVGLLVSLPVTLILTNSAKPRQDFRSKAAVNTPVPGKIIFVPFSFSREKDADGLLNFSDRAQIRNGFVPPVQTAASGVQFTAKILDANGNQVASPQKFSLPKVVAIDSIDASTHKEKAESREVSADSFALTLPYSQNAAFVEIINPKGFTIEIVAITNAYSTDNIIDMKEIKSDMMEKKKSSYRLNPLHINEVFAANGAFRIAIIGDNYSGDNTHFQSDVNDIAAGLLSIEPFKSNKTNIIFYPQLSTVQLCTFTSNLNCNDTLALQQASSVPYDKVYVLYNGPYAGYAYVGATLSYGTTATDKSLSVKQGLFIHELGGHALGGLMDEFSYGTTGVPYAPNCSDSPSCPSWSAIPGLGCFSVCGYTNLFRATDNSSVMNTALLSGVTSFDPFSTQIVQGKLTPYFTASPPTATLPPPIPTPTATIILSPTPVATVTPAATPTSVVPPAARSATSSAQRSNTAAGGFSAEPTATIIPTATVFPSATATPQPSPAPRCFFPNFCTGPSFCEPENILPLNCDSSAVVCCKVQTPTGDSLLVMQRNITPTLAQRLDQTPTATGFVTATPTSPPVSTLIPTIPTAAFSPPAPTSSNQPAQPQEAPPPTTAPQQQPPNYVPPPPSPTTLPVEENYPVYATPTSYQPENIVFERATPTPRPRIGIVDILTAPSRFANTLIKSFFSLFTGK